MFKRSCGASHTPARRELGRLSAAFALAGEYAPASAGLPGIGVAGKAIPGTSDNTQLMAPALIVVAIVLVVIGVVVARKGRHGGDGGPSDDGSKSGGRHFKK
jgi:hypothetical protein